MIFDLRGLNEENGRKTSCEWYKFTSVDLFIMWPAKVPS